MIPILILFHPPDAGDIISILCHRLGVWAGFEMGDLAHTSLLIEDKVYELNWAGISMYDWDDFYRPVNDSIFLLVSIEEAALIYARILALVRANVRMHVSDLIRMVLRMPLKGLICTDFVDLILGYEPSHCTPLRLLERYGNARG